MPRYQWMPVADFRGGRNASNDPLSLGETQVTQMRNGDTYRTSLFRKKGGATAPAIGSAFTGVISSLIAHFPDNNPSNAELWGVDDANPPIVARMAAATTFTAVTLTDAVTAGAGAKVRGASYNGKLFLAYQSAQDLLHAYDPTLSAPRVRRVGLATPAAPTVADTGSGTYAATVRYYRQRYRIKNGTIVVAQSEPSASVTFTPSGSGTAARVTKATTISESETHWVLEGSADNATFYELAETVVGTTTADDSTAPSAYGGTTAQPLSPLLGAYVRPTSAKYLIAAFNRMLMMGSYATGGKQSRIWFTPAKGTSDKADDERVPDTLTVRNFIDVGEGTGGDGTGFAGPIYGAVYVFKYSQIKKMTPTGAASPVWDIIDLSLTMGAIEQECIAVGEDARNQPAIYFLDAQVGPAMMGAMPPTPIGDGVRDFWDIVNLSATTKVGQVINYPKLGQVKFWWATGVNTEPNICATYTKATGGWSVEDTGGKLRLARCAVLFARTPGALMSRDKVPYIGYQASNNTLLRGDTTDTSDDGTAYQAIVKTRPFVWNGGKPFRTTAPWILAKAQDGVTLTITADADFGKETRPTTISLTLTATEAAAGATRVWRKAEGLDFEGATFLQLQIGDAAAIANTWQIERIYVPVSREDVEP